MSLAAVLDAATDDTLLAIAIALPTSADLLQLALTCRAAGDPAGLGRRGWRPAWSDGRAHR